MLIKNILITIRYLRAFAIIFGCLFVGNFLSNHLPIAIPGSIIGLLLLFCLLAFGLIPTLWVANGCQLFIRYIVILFIPASVGIMNYYSILIAQFAPIILACIVSTIVVLISTGYLAEYIYRRSERTLNHHKESH